MSFIILFTVKTVKIVDHLYSLIIYSVMLLNLSRVYTLLYHEIIVLLIIGL